MEAEYIAISEAVKESIWLQGLLQEIRKSGITGDKSGDTSGDTSGEGSHMAQILNSDNQGAISLAENPQNHQRSKHIDIKYHFVRHQVKEGRIDLRYLPTAQTTADVLTKALPREPH